ncbi:MAG: hypothetical protein A07HR67_02775 [uncultured archaeon A07HR67]|jgi:hypothetical protein|nr:MAG: hypothetical protein A07HR67_02775 [uncultured archaeon A07HR67]
MVSCVVGFIPQLKSWAFSSILCNSTVRRLGEANAAADIAVF